MKGDKEPTQEEIFLLTLYSLMEQNQDLVLKNLITPAKIKIEKTNNYYGYAGKYEKYIEIGVRPEIKSQVEGNIKIIQNYCDQIFDDDEIHALAGIRIKALQLQDAVIVNSTIIIYSSIQSYIILLNKIDSTPSIDKIEKHYLIEGCKSAINHNRSAAAVMYGCAGERLLIKICDSYHQFLVNSGANQTIIEKFIKKVVNARFESD